MHLYCFVIYSDWKERPVVLPKFIFFLVQLCLEQRRLPSLVNNTAVAGACSNLEYIDYYYTVSCSYFKCAFLSAWKLHTKDWTRICRGSGQETFARSRRAACTARTHESVHPTALTTVAVLCRLLVLSWSSCLTYIPVLVFLQDRS